ncbi:hypothetical protein [Actinomadura parmotrematis]|uniref:Transcriptional regulator n=1 Tax=Actinomadura parmotrematis TaxID=2864039 RepID=A0ABS7FYU3_9ACTN|nr:hypothetical protein [Actinomadura parmotrematis]MBW8485615.1 hypothetical protein [Actinomadura parmotrematis]
MERVADDRLRVCLRRADGVAARTAGLAAAEAACCSFFEFTLRIGGALVLEVTVPRRHADVLAALAARAEAAAR